MQALRRFFDPEAPPWSRRAQVVFEAVVFATYVALLIFTAWHHEMWRDEVRALSLARGGESVSAMLRGLIGEGHPAVWYLMLRLASLVSTSPLVLPIVSGLVAIAAVGLMLRSAPFAPGQKLLLTFGVYFAYEYSVMSRNYGIGVLLLFVAAAKWSWRFDRPIFWGALLAVLANTSAPAAMAALALGAVWIWECYLSGPVAPKPAQLASARRQLPLGLGIAVCGAMASVLVAMPTSAALSTDVLQATPVKIAFELMKSVVKPGAPFRALIPLSAPAGWEELSSFVSAVLANGLFALVVVGLWRRWALLLTFLLALLATELFFRLVTYPELRHVGVMFMLVLVLYWRALREPDPGSVAEPAPRGRRLFWFLTVPLTAVMALHVLTGATMAGRDDRRDFSASKALGLLLRQPEYRDAIVMSEPDYLIEPVPYYADNRLYFPRREAFGNHVLFTTVERPRLSLSELLASADRINAATGTPVLIVLGTSLRATESATLSVGFGRQFSWTGAERAEFLSRVREVAEFPDAITDEHYTVYELQVRRPPNIRR